MHSSRMRTGRSLTICRSLLPRGGVCYWGVSARGGVCLIQGGCLPLGGCLLQGSIPACTEADTPLPPVNRITDTSKNITLATTSFRPVNMTKENRINLFESGVSRPVNQYYFPPDQDYVLLILLVSIGAESTFHFLTLISIFSNIIHHILLTNE